MNSDLVRYCEEQLKAGFSVKVLRSALLARGWAVTDVDAVLDSLSKKLVADKGFRGPNDPIVKDVRPVVAEDTVAVEESESLLMMTTSNEKGKPVDNVVKSNSYVTESDEPHRVRMTEKGGNGRRTLLWLGLLLFFLLLIVGGWWLYVKVWLSPERILSKAWSNEFADPVRSAEFQAKIAFTTRIPEVELDEWQRANQQVLGVSYNPEAVGVESVSADNVRGEVSFSGWLDWRERQLLGDVSLRLTSPGLAEIDSGLRALFLDVKLPETPELLVRLGHEGALSEELVNFEQFFNRWVAYQYEPLLNEYDERVSAYTISINSDEDLGEQLLESAWNKDVFTISDLGGDDSLNGQNLWHYEIGLAEDAWESWMIESVRMLNDGVITQEQEDLIRELGPYVADQGIEVWVGKNDYRVHRVLWAVGGTDNESYVGNSVLDLAWWNINQDFVVERPELVTSWEDYSGELTSVYMGDMSGTDFEPIDAFSVEEPSLFGEFAAEDRDAQRAMDVVVLAEALENLIDDDIEIKGLLSVGQGNSLRIGKDNGYFDLEPLLVPDYMNELPVDPLFGSELDTYYRVYITATGDVVVWAYGELEDEISSVRVGF